ncbi:hypothetical protein CEXT_621781 [Caerostris extrusa]|uniref:Uncharacterized protein n=1 Tax=Caerostris extrusa TaxID=172846 RepID=A0AAV4N8B5_CAEEX|nr:hypothetical protein CEXT_621781 [Caerostris extrusa]
MREPSHQSALCEADQSDLCIPPLRFRRVSGEHAVIGRHPRPVARGGRIQAGLLLQGEGGPHHPEDAGLGIPNKFLSDESFKLHLTDQRRGGDSNSGNQERQLSVQDISGE